MGIDAILFCPSGERWRTRLFELDDGYYAFLQPWFSKIENTCGEYIDSYGTAEFHSGKGLGTLQSSMEEARTKAGSSNARFEIEIGVQIYPIRRRLTAVVERQRLLKKIEDILDLVVKCKECDGRLRFEGD